MTIFGKYRVHPQATVRHSLPTGKMPTSPAPRPLSPVPSSCQFKAVKGGPGVWSYSGAQLSPPLPVYMAVT